MRNQIVVALMFLGLSAAQKIKEIHLNNIKANESSIVIDRELAVPTEALVKSDLNGTDRFPCSGTRCLISVRWRSEGNVINITLLSTNGTAADTVVLFTDYLLQNQSAQLLNNASASDGSTTAIPVLFYPLYDNSLNRSLVLGNGTANMSWRVSSTTLAINETNPQLVYVTDITRVSVSLVCFVCSCGLETLIGNYTLKVNDSGTVTTKNLYNYSVDLNGYYTVPLNVSDPKSATYALEFFYRSNASVCESGQSNWSTRGGQRDLRNPFTDSPAVIDYPDTIPLKGQLFLNEIHPSSGPSDNLWLELIGKPNISLADYCIELLAQDGEKLTNSSCSSITESINLNGFLIWNNLSGSSDRALLSAFANKTGGPIFTVKLNYRSPGGRMTTLDSLSYKWVPDATNATLSCGSTVSLLNSTILLMSAASYSKDQSMSRCGLKYSSPASWQNSQKTYKLWNSCVPCAYLYKVNLTNDIVVVKSSDGSNLPDQGLMVTLWQSAGAIKPLAAASITPPLSEPPCSPITEITVHFSKNASSVEQLRCSHVYVSGGVLSSFVENSVYAVSLSHYYDFLPSLQFTDMRVHIVDAVVYSKTNTEINITMVATFMDVNDLRNRDQGQITLVSTTALLTNGNGTKLRDTSLWQVVDSQGRRPDLSVLWIRQEVMKYLRIYQIGPVSAPYITLKLLPLSGRLAELFNDDNVFPLSGLSVLFCSGNGSAFNAHSLETIQITPGKTKQVLLPTGAKWHYYGTTIILLMKGNTEFLLNTFSLNDMIESTDLSRMLDGVKLNYTSGSPEDKRIADSTGFSKDYGSCTVPGDNDVIMRCFSDKDYYNVAFAVVPATTPVCPVPSSLRIERFCSSSFTVSNPLPLVPDPFPTDYLYLYQINSSRLISNVVQLQNIAPTYKRWDLSDRRITMVQNLNHGSVDSLVLGWFPDGPPIAGATFSSFNSTIDAIVTYDEQASVKDAKRLLNSISESSNNGIVLQEPVLVPPGDARVCVLICNGTAERIKLGLMADEISFCGNSIQQGILSIRISEVNVDSKGFADTEEFVEIQGNPGVTLGGLTLAVLTSKTGNHLIYERLVDLNDVGIDWSGFYLLSHNKDLQPHQDLPMQRFFPNRLGAVALLWGKAFLPEICEGAEVQATHVSMTYLFLDVVAYAEDASDAHGDAANLMTNVFAPRDPGAILVETMGDFGGNETLSRCYCNDTWRYDCFELSPQHTPGKPNYCLNAVQKQLTICYKRKSGDSTATPDLMILPKTVEEKVSNKYAFSQHQVKVENSCPVGMPEDETFMVNVTLGFPSEEVFRMIDGLLEWESALGGDWSTITCGAAACPHHESPPVSPDQHQKTVVAAAAGTVAIVVVIVIIIFTVICLKKRNQHKRYEQAARFDAGGEDDDANIGDSFMADSRVSFSNPWYNRNASNNIRPSYTALG